MKPHLGPRGQKFLNVYLFLNVIGFCGWSLYRAAVEGRFGYVEAGFAAQNILLAVFLLTRKDPTGTDPSLFHQFIALTAFCSGAFFMGRPATEDAILLNASRGVIFAANVLGGLSLLSLGRSFGILIALREVKTRRLYSIVRHPMYATDILLRIGYLLSHIDLLTAALFVVSSGCYVYRALLEERFLSARPEYREYMARVRFRFIPGVF